MLIGNLYAPKFLAGTDCGVLLGASNSIEQQKTLAFIASVFL